MSLPQFTVTSKLSEDTAKTTLLSVIRVINALLTNLLQIFTSLLGKTQLDSLILTNVQLKPGMNSIPHTLGRTLTGWQIIRQRGDASIYDTQDTCPNPSTNLQLVTNNAVSVDLLVF